MPNAFAQVIATTMFCLAVAATTSDSVFGDPIEDSGKTTPSGLAVDRKTTFVVASFRQHVANSRFDAAVDDFQRLQTSDAVLMVPAGDSRRTFAPLYRILFNSFFELPSTYQRRIAQGLEIPARRRLMQIVAEFDYGQIPDLIRQYAGTEASLQAHILMARQHLDRGNTLGVRAWVAPLTLGNVTNAIVKWH